MNFIALKMLVGDRAKYIGIFIGLTFGDTLTTSSRSKARTFCDQTTT